MNKHIKKVVMMSLCLLTALLAMAQSTGWYYRDIKKENKAAQSVLKDNKVQPMFRGAYMTKICDAFNELWRTAQVDSLYDWSCVDLKMQELSDKQKELRSLEEKAAAAEAQEQEDESEDWATPEAINEYKKFKANAIDTIQQASIVADSLEFVNRWTQELIDKKRQEAEKVLNFVNEWDGSSSAQADQMLKKFKEMKDELTLLCGMPSQEYDEKLRSNQQIQEGNMTAQLEREISSYLTSKPYVKEITEKYLQQCKNKELHKALEQQGLIYSEFADKLKNIRKMISIDADNRQYVLNALTKFLNQYDDRNRYSYPYMDRMRKVITDFMEKVKTPDALNGEQKLNNAINNSINRL